MQVDAASGLLAVAHEQAELRVYQFWPSEREIGVAVLGTTPGAAPGSWQGSQLALCKRTTCLCPAAGLLLPACN